MKTNRFIDTNIFIRFLTGDVPKKAKRAKKIIERLEKGEIKAEISDLVVAELVWVLESFYNLPPKKVAEKVSYIVSLQGIKMLNKKLTLDSLVDYVNKKVDFVDAYNANYMKHHKISTIYSYDGDFDKLGMHRIEP